MKKKRQIISARIREKILSESEMSGVIISEVAAKYKISTHLLYSWRSKRKKSTTTNLQNGVEEKNNNAEANFVELKVKRPGSKPVAASHPRKLLKKLTLEFEDMSLAIDGGISSKKLMGLIAVLEGTC